MSKRAIAFAVICILTTAVCHADPRFASLKVTSVPTDAHVYFDGQIRGTTPIEIPGIEPGQHTLRLTKRGFRDSVKELSLEPGKAQAEEIALVALTPAELDSAQKTGLTEPGRYPPDYRHSGLKLITKPDGALVNLAGDSLGTTPVTTTRVIPGKRSLSVKRPGYRPISQVLDFTAGKTIELNLVLDSMTQRQIDSARSSEDAYKVMRESLRKTPRSTGSDKGVYDHMDKNPEPIFKPQPEYPRVAAAKGVGGKVLVQMLVDTDGSVIRADIQQSSGDKSLDQAAREAALQWTFTPAIAPGKKPVRVWVTQTFNFRMMSSRPGQGDSTRSANATRLPLPHDPRGDIPDKNAFVAVEKNPEPLKMPQPVYPNKEKKYGIGGKVFIQMLVDTDGKVIRADIAKSSGVPALDAAAVEAAYQWMFSPAMAPGNKPVRVWVMQAFTFRVN